LAVRRDAFQAAVSVVNELNRLVAAQPDDLRFTIGRFEVKPNTANSVADEVSFSIDLRHPEAALVESFGDAIMSVCSGERLGCQVTIKEDFNRPPCDFTPEIVDLVETAAGRLQESHLRLASGAFHDALFMNDICPTGMIFVPCERGISHNPAENADPDDLAAGARVLLASLVALANQQASPLRTSRKKAWS
jgi:N-carbamoyl-L-amino-acid hydrolase